MNFKEMCRTCLRSEEMMSSIFDEEIEPAKHTAAELLAIFTSIQVDKEDDFPHNICDNCLKEIQQAYLFDLKCKKSEIILHQLREIRVNLKNVKAIPKRNDIVSEVAGELESILKEDFKLEHVMHLCDRNISVSESFAIGRIRSVEEENRNASDKLNLRDFQLALKSEHDHSDHLMKYNTNVKDVERIRIVSNFQIVEDDSYPQITLKQEPDNNSLIIKNNPAQNELELNQNFSNIEILDEYASDYQGIFNTERNQNNLIIKVNENKEEFSEMSSNFQVVEEECVLDFHVTFKSEPELDIGIDCYGEQFKCSACLKHFQSRDMFRGHIVSDHLEENICKLCNEEFECSQLEHSTKHLPFSHLVAIEPDNTSDSIEESLRQTEKVQMTAIHKDEYRLVNHMCTHPGENAFGCELCLNKSGSSSALLCHRRSKQTDELIINDKLVPHFQCGVCSKIFNNKWLLRRHMPVHTGGQPFQCELCPAKFRHSNTLQCHRRTKHTDELLSADKLQCSVCSKFFGHKYLLRDHIRLHTGEKPFQCKLCPEKFRKSETLRCHRRTKHTDELIGDDKPVPDLQCSVCNKVFGIKQQLKNHMRLHTGENPFQCQLCPAKFRHRNTLQCHRRTKHTNELLSDDKLQCSVCSKIFGQKYLLKDHIRLHTGEKPFQCTLCPEKFRKSETLLCHRRTKHTDELLSDDKLQCSVCSKIFGHKYLLRDHIRLHTGEKPFQCTLCPEKFRKSETLLCHRRTKHSDELIGDNKPVPDFQCSVCSKVFGIKHQLKNHMRVHTGEKPFQCELCPAKFGHSNTLLCHRRTKHTDELISTDKTVPDLQCSVCSKIFGQKSLLRYHMLVHTGENPFQCKLCPEKFRDKPGLLSHKRVKHTDELISGDKPVPDFQCSICYKVFGQKYKLKNHMRVHTGEKPFNCELCPAKFSHSATLRKHKRTKHVDELVSDDKPVPDFQCSVCNKVFGMKYQLKEHMRVHTGEKPYQCQLCPAKFGSSSNLLYHRRTKHTDKLISDDNPEAKLSTQ